jgi:hypothetical protein
VHRSARALAKVSRFVIVSTEMSTSPTALARHLEDYLLPGEAAAMMEVEDGSVTEGRGESQPFLEKSR